MDGTNIGVKDENGIYLPSTPPELKAAVRGVLESTKTKLVEDISIDSLLHRGFRTIHGIIRAIEIDVGTGAPSRETIMNLKDVMAMLKDLKKEEREFLESLSDEDLVRLNKDANSK